MLGIIIDSISTFMYSKLLVILLIGAGIYFTIRTKLPQMRLFKDACKAVVEKPEDENGVSSFQALMVSTASRVGTGNIIGVSSAICIGGFGSVFWMWIIAIIGSASALIESTLAQIYKRKGKDGECYGGPAYYIEAALHCRPLAIIFCISMIATYAFGFNMLASYNLQSTFSGFSFYDVKWTPWMVSLRRGIKNCKSNIYISASYGGCIYSDLCDRYDHQPCISAGCIFKDHQRSI